MFCSGGSVAQLWFRLDVELATTRLDAHGMGNSARMPMGMPTDP